MIELRGYVDENGNKRFVERFQPARLQCQSDHRADAYGGGKIYRRPRASGAGLYEYKIDFGPGFRIYFGRDGERIVILTVAQRNARTRTFRRRRHAGLTTND